ncbi:MAG: hypothetical protein Q7R40_18220 [Phaeospirillum sp.]|nr:hypothetical protein [Phaeospirillum sp.]
MIVIWDKRLSTGDAAIDAEHRLVFDLLNELDVACAVTAPAVVVQKTLEALARTVDRHFGRNGPSEHMGGHAALASKVHRLLADWQGGIIQEIDRRTLMNLGRCWIDHMGRRECIAPAPGYRPNSSSSGCHSAA